MPKVLIEHTRRVDLQWDGRPIAQIIGSIRKKYRVNDYADFILNRGGATNPAVKNGRPWVLCSLQYKKLE